MFESFFEKINEPFRSDFGHNASVLIWLWVIYAFLFLALLMRDFFSVRRKVLLGKDLDDGEKQDIHTSMNINWLFVASGACLNLYQIQYIMFHNSAWWTAFCCVLAVLEIALIIYEVRRNRNLEHSIQNKTYSLVGKWWIHTTLAFAAVFLPLFGAFMAQAQYFHDQQFLGC